MLPPVMGVAAFLMADIIGVPYLDIVKAGIIPAALFYFSVCLAVHFTILKFGWISSDLSSFDWRLLLGGVHFAVPMTVLLTTLVYLQFTPFASGMYTIFSIVLVMYVRNFLVDVLHVGTDTQSTADGEGVSGDTIVKNLLGTTKQTLDGLKQGGVEMAPLVGVLAAMGVIVKLLDGSGLTARVATSIIGMSDVSLFGFGGGLFVVLFLAMIASILFGLGMPTPAAYILVAILVAKPVTELGTPDITTHMFVFYFAMLSAITPPVAISVAIGSRIANASFMRSCVQSLRLGAPGFVIPYAFVANNSLIEWSGETVIAFPVVLAGTIGLIVATVASTVHGTSRHRPGHSTSSPHSVPCSVRLSTLQCNSSPRRASSACCSTLGSSWAMKYRPRRTPGSRRRPSTDRGLGPGHTAVRSRFRNNRSKCNYRVTTLLWASDNHTQGMTNLVREVGETVDANPESPAIAYQGPNGPTRSSGSERGSSHKRSRTAASARATASESISRTCRSSSPPSTARFVPAGSSSR